MTFRLAAVVSAGLILVMLALSAWALGQLPAGAEVPIHYGPSGEADRWVDATWGVFLVPVLAALVWLLMAVLPRIAPKGENLRRSAKAYGWTWVGVTVLVTVLHAVTLGDALGADVNVTRPMLALMGGLFVLIGNFMGKVRHNFVFGIRTPWTLASERVWDKTHRFAGWAFVIGGLVLLAGALVLPTGMPAVATFVGVLVALLVGVTLRSYLLWRSERRSHG